MAADKDNLNALDRARRDSAQLEHLLPLDPVDYAAIDIPPVIIDEDDQPAINREKYNVKWQWLAPDEFPLTLDGGVGNYGETTCFVEQAGTAAGDVEVIAHMSHSTGRFSVTPYSQSLNMDLSNKPIANNLIFGKGTFGGGPWPVSLYEPFTGALIYKCNNLDAGPGDNLVYIQPIARRFLGEESAESIEARRAAFITTRINSFWMAPDEGAEVDLAAGNGNTADVEMSVPSIGDFLAITFLDDTTDAAGNAPGDVDIFVQIQDGLTGYSLTSVPIPWRAFVAACSLLATNNNLRAASFEGPFAGILTHIFARSTKIIMTFTNKVNTAWVLRVGARGLLLRYKPAKGRDTNTSREVRKIMLGRSVRMPLRTFSPKTGS